MYNAEVLVVRGSVRQCLPGLCGQACWYGFCGHVGFCKGVACALQECRVLQILCGVVETFPR
jgi:hypothetical protein